MKEDGTIASEREVFNSLVGEKIPLSDGDVEIVGRLPGKDMYNELYRRYPKKHGGAEDVKQLNSDVNYNMKELLENSDAKRLNMSDVDERHAEQGISGFDTRTVKFFDGSKAYTIDFSIATLENGKKIAYAKKFFGYDATLTKKIQDVESRSEKTLHSINDPVSNSSISQNSKNVNSHFEKSETTSPLEDIGPVRDGFSNDARAATGIEQWKDGGQYTAADNIGTFDRSNPDIRYSFSGTDIAPVRGNFNISGEDVRLEGPVAEDIAPIYYDTASGQRSTAAVEGGVISQETADLWSKMYPNYVPIMPPLGGKFEKSLAMEKKL